MRSRSEKGPEQQPAVHAQPERHAAEGTHVVLALGRRRGAVRLGEHLRGHADGTAHGRRAPADRSAQLHRPGRSRAVNKAHTLRADVPAERQRPAQPRRRRLRPGRSRLRAGPSHDSMFRLVGERPARHGLVRRVAAPGPPGRRPTPSPSSKRRRSACSTRSRRAARSRPADGAAPTSSGPPTSTGRAGGTRCASASLVEGGCYRSDNAHQLPRHLHVREPRRLRGAASPTTYTRRDGNPLVEYSHWQAGLYVQDDWRARKNLTLSVGLRQEFQTHLGDAVEPRAARRRSPGRRSRAAGRPSAPAAASSTTGSRRTSTSRRCASTASASRISSSVNPGYPDPFGGGARRACCRRASTCSPTGSSCRSAQMVNCRRLAADLADRRAEREL